MQMQRYVFNIRKLVSKLRISLIEGPWLADEHCKCLSIHRNVQRLGQMSYSIPYPMNIYAANIVFYPQYRNNQSH